MEPWNELEEESPTTTDPTELPFVVWLRGDEPFFSEFSLHADQVMEILGIKRSRLTQISGRELRVGKTRVDRYIKPVYRPEDVEAYAEWTRPTATHKKSSSVVEEACHNLTKHSRTLVDKITSFEEDLLFQWTQGLKQQHQETSSHLKKFLSQEVQTLRQFLYQNQSALMDQQNFFTQTQKGTQDHLQSLMPFLEILPNLLTQVQYLSETQLHLQNRLDQIASGLREMMKKKPTYRYILAFGSNVGEREAHLKFGLDHLVNFGEVIQSSSWIETEPLDSLDYDTQDHESYINFVVDFASELSPDALYAQIVFAENLRGHNRTQRWKPRALDIDILFWAQNTSPEFLKCTQLTWDKPESISGTVQRRKAQKNSLQIPHPQVQNREFWQRLFAEVVSETNFM